jgi:hypothetical protein
MARFRSGRARTPLAIQVRPARTVPRHMSMRSLLVFALLLAGAACGSSGPSPNELADANHLTAENEAQGSQFCCYVNGDATEESPGVCAVQPSGCTWTTTYDEVNASGRGTLCGNLTCP